MALNIDHGFLSDTDTLNQLLAILKPPSSPTESESSDESGISSLDSDDLKKQSTASPTTSQDDDQPQEATVFEEEKYTENEVIELTNEHEEHVREETPTVISTPVKIIYQRRDILDLSYLREPREIVKYTVLPENSIGVFFQNRAQYWRLSTGDTRQECVEEKCGCCDFTYPSCEQYNRKNANNKNAITDSLMAFIKSNEDIQTPAIPPKRFNANMQYAYQSQPQQYHRPAAAPSGYYSNNSYNYNQMNQPMNSDTSLALLNIMNASKNAASAFQTMSNGNNSHHPYYNNVNNNYGLYKQF